MGLWHKSRSAAVCSEAHAQALQPTPQAESGVLRGLASSHEDTIKLLLGSSGKAWRQASRMLAHRHFEHDRAAAGSWFMWVYR